LADAGIEDRDRLGERVVDLKVRRALPRLPRRLPAQLELPLVRRVRLRLEFLLVERLRPRGRVAWRAAQPGLAVARVQVLGDQQAVSLPVHLRPWLQAQPGRAGPPPAAPRLALHVEVVPRPPPLLLEGVVRVEALDELGDDGHGTPSRV